MGSEFTINIKLKPFKCNKDFQKIKANNKYLFTSSRYDIDIYNLSENIEINYRNSIDPNQIITHIDTSPFYPNIISSSLKDGNIKLWKIDELDQDENKEICIIKAHERDGRYSLFNPVYEYIIISSDYNNIKLWDITKYNYLYDISNEGIIDNLQWDTTGEYYGYINDIIKGTELIIREKNNNKDIITIKEDIDEFLFIRDIKILTFSKNIIKCWDMRNIQKSFKTTNIDSSPSSIIYDSNYNYLYFNSFTSFRSFDIFDINDFNIKYSKKDIILDDNSILLNNDFLKGKEISNILHLNNNSSKIIKVNNENQRPIPLKNKKTEEDYKNYLKNMVYKISYDNNLFKYEDNNNIEEINFIKKKNYFMIPEIEKELDKLKDETIYKRKEYVKNELTKNQTIINIKEQYIYYLKLIIRDNTNKKLIKEYLKFLKSNQKEIKEYFQNIEEYKDEILFYKVCLNQNDLKELGEYKDKSEKEKFIEFIKELSNINDIVKNISQIKNIDEISFFNQPIDLNNEELFYYKNKIIIYLDILNKKHYSTNLYKFWLKQNLIRDILNKKIFENNDIIKNIDKLNLIINLISEPECDNYTNEYLLNLLNSNICNNEDINEIISKTNCKKFVINGKIALVIGNFIYDYDTLENLSKDNFIKYYKNTGIKNEEYYLEELYSFDYLLNEINKDLYLKDIKNFLKVILKRKVFNEAFELVYGEENLHYFLNESILNEIIDNHIKFIPFLSYDNCGMTDRYTMDTYIFIERKPIIYNNIGNNNENKKLVEDALKIGRIISIIFHEINNIIYSYLLYFYNNINYSFQKQKKIKISEFKERGFYMEYNLFGRIIESLNLKEAMYIMNIDNYNKDIKKFQKDFINLNGKSNINGVFSKFNVINQFDNYDSIKSCIIKTKNITKINPLENISIDY